jgi:hypothetical protein
MWGWQIYKPHTRTSLKVKFCISDAKYSIMLLEIRLNKHNMQLSRLLPYLVCRQTVTRTRVIVQRSFTEILCGNGRRNSLKLQATKKKKELL